MANHYYHVLNMYDVLSLYESGRRTLCLLMIMNLHKGGEMKANVRVLVIIRNLIYSYSHFSIISTVH